MPGVRRLHLRIFGHVWTWAGTYRRSGTSIGIDWTPISVAVRNLVADAALWFEHDHVEQAAARLHHRLVEVHPFPDGNGRHAWPMQPVTSVTSLPTAAPSAVL